jgi:hypothetical protein
MCGTVCPAFAGCTNGVCVCPQGTTACQVGMFGMRQCVDLQTNPNFCGNCNTRCMNGLLCDNGQCAAQCSPGLAHCGNSCVDLSSSKFNCGFCQTTCGGNLVCVNGICACPQGDTDCAGFCVNTSTDRTNCGNCGVTCPNGQNCVGGVCK